MLNPKPETLKPQNSGSHQGFFGSFQVSDGRVEDVGSNRLPEPRKYAQSWPFIAAGTFFTHFRRV